MMGLISAEGMSCQMETNHSMVDRILYMCGKATN